MPDTTVETKGRAAGAARQDRPDAPDRRVAELEAENAALRRALAEARRGAEGAGDRHGTELSRERAGRAAEAADARSAAVDAAARHGREMAAGRADLAAAEDANTALRRANAELGASRAALREREERLRLVLDSATEYAIIGMGLDRRVASWNAGAERLLGWAEAEIVGRPADLIFTPEDRGDGAPEREAAGALAEGRAENERWHVREDGSRFWGSGLVMPLRDPDAGPGAAPVGLLKVMRDRTAERGAEEEARLRERRLRLLADTASGLLAAADPDEVLAPVFRVLSREFGVDALLSYVAAEDEGLALASCFGLAGEERPPFALLAAGEGVCGQAARERRPVHVPDAAAAAAAGDPRCARAAAVGIRAFSAFPLVAGGDRLLGILTFASRRRAGFPAEDLSFFGAIAHHFAVVRERLRTEAVLRESEARHRALFDSIDEGFCVVEVLFDAAGRRAVDYRFLEVNPAFERHTGMVGAAGRTMREFEPDHEEHWFETYGRVALTGEPVRFEDRADKLGGRWFDVYAFRVGPPEARRVGILFSDITGRKRTEAALREGEARFRGLFERMQEGLSLAEMVHGPGGEAVDYRFLEVNDAWERQTGVPRAAAAGRSIREVLTAEEAAFWVAAYARVAATGEPEHAERRIPSLGRWFEVTMYRAGPGRVAALVSDTTGRKAAEARRDALVELGDRLRDPRDPGEIAHAAAEAIGRALGASGAGYVRVDPDEDGIRIERDWTSGPAVASIAGSHRLSDYWTGGDVLDRLRRGEVVAIGDVARDPRTAPRLAAFAAKGIGSCAYAPVVEGGRLAALLFVHAAEVRGWTGEEAAFVRGVAERAWAAAERARAEAALRAHAARQAFRLAFEERLRALVDPDAIMGEAVALLGRHLGADRVGYAEIVGDAVVRAAGSYAANGIAPLDRDFPIGAFGAAMVARQRRGVTEVCDDVQADPERAGDVWAAIDTRSVVSVPLVRGGRFRASLYVNNRGPRRWAAEDVALVEEVAARTWDAVGRARAEAALRESERRLRATQDHAGVGITEVDAEGRYLRVNDTFARLSGRTAADLAGRPYWDEIADEGERRENRREFGRFVRGEVDGMHAQRECTSRDGRRWWAEIAAQAVRDEGGRFLYAVRIVQDVTERRRAEEALRESEGRRRAAMAAARLGTFDWDPATGAVALDGRARDIFGFAPGEGGHDGEVFGRIHPGDLPGVHAASMAAAAALSRLEQEYRVCLPGGAVRAVASLGDFLPGAGGGGGGGRMVGVFADITERRQAEERRALLVNELNHRVKNTLAVVQSLALQTARGAPDLPSFGKAFQARLIALARAHDLLTRTDWEGAPLAGVARAALEGIGDRVDLRACSPPDALLPPAQALALAMALHELATNALKHGALSVPGGRVSLACAVDPGDGARVLEWVERGGPPLAGPPARKGFGLRLLERGLAAQAGMAADLRFDPEGVRCVLRLPPPPRTAPPTAPEAGRA